MPYLLAYTRLPINEVLYDPRLAFSLHLAVSEDGVQYQALNHNSGVLFAKAEENADGSLNPKTLRKPYLFAFREGGFGVLAERGDEDGEKDEGSEGRLLLFLTEDFITYQEKGLIPKEEAERLMEENAQGQCGGPGAQELTIEGAVPQNVLQIPEDMAGRLRRKLLVPVNCGMEFPERITASNPEELGKYRALALYSDGTKAEMTVDWDLSVIDFDRPGRYVLRGQAHQDRYPFPVAFNRADPCIGRWNGKYYYIATNDADGNHSLYIREADTIPGLVNAEEKLILDSSMYPGIGGLLWAPEFHEIEGRLYLFHAATPGEFFWEESHIMELKEGGNPSCKEDWSAPERIVRRDGTDLCEAGKVITLDMTCFKWEGEYYVIWSQRQLLPKDLGAWLYIAKIDPKDPRRLLTDPVLLLKPDYGWSNNHTFVVEGPFALPRGNTLYVTFSGAAVDTSYAVGILRIEKGLDLLEASNWKQGNYPILTSRSVEGEYGTGHNAYITDENGIIWNTYHARPGTGGARSSGIRRVHFDEDGDPRLDLTAERELLPEYAMIQTELIVPERSKEQ